MSVPLVRVYIVDWRHIDRLTGSAILLVNALVNQVDCVEGL